MMNIQMVDLKNQYEIIKDEIDLAIIDVVKNSSFINGESVSEFTNNFSKYLNVKYVVPCANGTDALQIALMSLDLKPGDEIITTPFTFIATAEVIALLGLKIVFVDVEYDSFLMNIDQLEDKITERTKVILPVHLFGQCVNMDKIRSIAKKNNLFVIEDTAQAIGSEYTFSDGSSLKAGTIGDIGCTSFFPSKNLGCYGDGGAIYTNNEDLAKKIKMITNHGSEKKYYHKIIGVNSRLDSIQAAILDVKLNYLDKYNSKRKEAANHYNILLENVDNVMIPQTVSNTTHVYHQYTLKIKNALRNDLKTRLFEKGIPSMIYYPIPIHLQEAYGHLGYRKGDYATSELLADEVLSLPMHTELEYDMQEYICTNIKAILSELS